MARDLKDETAWMDDVTRKLSRIFAGAILENSSITNGRMRFIGGTLRVDSGGRVEVVGTLQIDGTTTVTGTFKVEGPWDLKGNGTITGNVTQTGTLTVSGGGRVKVGTMTLDPSISGGAMTFGNGAQVFTDGSTIQVYKGNGVMQVSETEAKLQVGGTAIRVLSGQIFATGMATRAVSAFPGGFVGAIVYEAGEMKRLI